jgi:hypothetical protein
MKIEYALGLAVGFSLGRAAFEKKSKLDGIVVFSIHQALFARH